MTKLRIKNRSGKIIDAFFKELDLSYLDKIMELQEEIYKGLEDKQLFAKTDREEFIKSFERGKVIGCLDEEDNLIAMGVYLKKGYDKENYAYDLDLEGEILLKTAQIETTVVKEEYRGNRLQRIICERIEEIAREDGMEILAATVSPYNKYSLNTFLNSGYKIKKDKLKYGALRRYILSKELR